MTDTWLKWRIIHHGWYDHSLTPCSASWSVFLLIFKDIAITNFCSLCKSWNMTAPWKWSPPDTSQSALKKAPVGHPWMVTIFWSSIHNKGVSNYFCEGNLSGNILRATARGTLLNRKYFAPPYVRGLWTKIDGRKGRKSQRPPRTTSVDSHCPIQGPLTMLLVKWKEQHQEFASYGIATQKAVSYKLIPHYL
jgi:hypothetical protein